ncbi:MAG: hypothetical protein J5726_06690 [Treponema sp.]|nr:hypothetical protein [Treponema sp.]
MTQDEQKQKNAKKKYKFPFVFLSRLTRNAAFVLFLICIFLFLLYMIGNYQSFVDQTQLLILSILSFCAIVLCIMTVLSFLQEAVFLFIQKKKTGTIFSMLFFLFMLVLGVFFIVFASVIRRLSLGI